MMTGEKIILNSNLQARVTNDHIMKETGLTCLSPLWCDSCCSVVEVPEAVRKSGGAGSACGC